VARAKEWHMKWEEGWRRGAYFEESGRRVGGISKIPCLISSKFSFASSLYKVSRIKLKDKLQS